jgi:hypothetical protein
LTAGAAALAVGLTASASLATTAATWTVTPGGTWNGTMSGKFKLTDTASAKAIVCRNHAAGSFNSGSGLAGADIGSISTLTFSLCTLPGGAKVTLTAGNLPWNLTAQTYNPSITAGTTTGIVTGIHATISGRNCSATVDGSSATANDGSTQVHYHNSLAKLKIRTQPSTLHVYNVTGCAGFMSSGDAITLSSAYLLSPAQTITQP